MVRAGQVGANDARESTAKRDAVTQSTGCTARDALPRPAADGIDVFDVTQHKVVATSAGTEGANKAILVPQLDRGFSVNGDDTSTEGEYRDSAVLPELPFRPDVNRVGLPEKLKLLIYAPANLVALMWMDKSGRDSQWRFPCKPEREFSLV